MRIASIYEITFKRHIYTWLSAAVYFNTFFVSCIVALHVCCPVQSTNGHACSAADRVRVLTSVTWLVAGCCRMGPTSGVTIAPARACVLTIEQGGPPIALYTCTSECTQMTAWCSGCWMALIAVYSTRWQRQFDRLLHLHVSALV